MLKPTKNVFRQNIGLAVIIVAGFALMFATSAESANNFAANFLPFATPTPKKVVANTNKKSNQNSNSKAGSTSNKNSNAKSSTNKNSNSKANSNSKTTANKNSNSKTTNSNSKTTANKNSNSKSNSNSKMTANKNSNSKSNSKMTANKNSNSNSKSNSNAKSSNSKSSNSNAKSSNSNSMSMPKTDLPKYIVNSVSTRVKSSSASNAKELGRLKLGSIVGVSEQSSGKNGSSKIAYASGKTTKSGYVSAASLSAFSVAKSDEIYRTVVMKHWKDGMNFQTTTELVDFLTAVVPGIQNANTAAELGLIRLLALKNSLKFATPENQNKAAFKEWLTAQNDNIVFSEPAGEWFVRADTFWDLHKKSLKTPFAEQIAWTAAQNPLPGECEGYVNCYLYYFRSTYGEYLSNYPDGKNSAEALKIVSDSLAPIIADLTEKTVYNGPTDISDRADFNKYLAELRTIVSKMQSTDKEKVLQQLNQIGEGYR